MTSREHSIMGEGWDRFNIVANPRHPTYFARARRIADDLFFVVESDTPEHAANKLQAWKDAPLRPSYMDEGSYIMSEEYLAYKQRIGQ